jgi:putative monooxygenase
MTAADVKKVAYDAVPPNRRRGGDIRILLGPGTVGATSGFMGAGTLAPGERVTEHLHPYSEEFMYVVSGSITVHIEGDQVLTLGPGEGVMVPKGTRHKLANHGTEPAFAVFHSSPLAPRPDLGHVDTEPPAHDVPGPRA